MECHRNVLAWKLGVCATALVVVSGCGDSGPLAPAVIPAPPTSSAPQPIAQGTYTVSGVVSVVVGDLSVPVEGVHVEDSQRHVSVKTGADGSYTLRDVGGGAAYFYFAKEGFGSQTRQFALTADMRLDVQLVRQ
jgi:hypothetical protein